MSLYFACETHKLLPDTTGTTIEKESVFVVGGFFVFILTQVGIECTSPFLFVLLLLLSRQQASHIVVFTFFFLSCPSRNDNCPFTSLDVLTPTTQSPSVRLSLLIESNIDISWGALVSPHLFASNVTSFSRISVRSSLLCCVVF